MELVSLLAAVYIHAHMRVCLCVPVPYIYIYIAYFMRTSID